MLPKSIEELDKIRASCKALAVRRATVAAGMALVPIPGLDLLIDASVLGELIPKINRRFGLTPQQIKKLDEQKKSTIEEMIKVIGSDFAGRSITRGLIVAVLRRVARRAVKRRLTRYIPIVGRTAAVAFSYGAMMYISNSHIDACYKIARAAIEEGEQ